MAFTPYGFDGTVSEGAQVADLTVHPSEYGVGGFRGASGDCRVTIVSGVDRTVRVATGYAWGKGVSGYNGAAVDVQAAVIGSGTRWDTVVLRRDTSVNTLTPLILSGTSTQAIAAGREVSFSANKDDQPLALIRLVAGQSNVQEVVDLRCWAANGGVFAVSEYAKDYLTAPGTVLHVADKAWVRTTNGAGSDAWQQVFKTTADSGWVAPTTWGLNYGVNSTLRSRLVTDATGDWVELKGYLQPQTGSIGVGRTGSVAVLATGHAPSISKPFPAVRFVNGGSPEYIGDSAVTVSSSGNVYIDQTSTASAVHVDGIRFRKV